MVAPEKLIGVQGQASYMSMLSYGLEGKAIIIASVACRNSCSFQAMLKPSHIPMYLQAHLIKHAIDTWELISKI